MENAFQARQQLEDLWRHRLEETLERYHAAQSATMRARAEDRSERLHSPETSWAVMVALQAELEVLRECRHVLAVFNDLVQGRKIPGEPIRKASG